VKVVVIGAGIAGASAAYHLGLAGAAVTLVDRGDAGQATAAGAGIVCPWLSLVDDPPAYRLASGGAAYYPELVAKLTEDGAGDVGYKVVGALSLTGSVEQTAELAARARTRRADAPQVGEITELPAGEPATLFPPLARHFAAVHIAGAARVDGALMRDALLHGADRHGVQRHFGNAELRDGAVVVDGEPVAADAVVVAAGAWSPQLLPELSVEPQRGQIVHLRLPGVDTGRWPVVLPTASRHYLLAFDDSRVVVGATREPDAGFDHRVTAAGLREVLDEALTVAPGLADATVAETRIGFRPASAEPLVGRFGDVVVATGFGPTGLTMGPLAGAVAADLALGQTPRLDLSGLTPEGSG
jgi:glycine/D-amino acid oxidase-like deaminating enzyme